MKRVARTLEVSLAVHGPSGDQPTRDWRREEIAGIPSGLEQRVVQGIDTFAQDHRNTAAAALSGLARFIGGVSYVGNGAICSVYKKREEVFKVYRQTAEMDEAARQQFMHERVALCAGLKGYLGAMVTEQELFIGEHPLGDYRVVMARQPFVSGGRLDLFATRTLDLNSADIMAYCERQPAGQTQLTGLVEATFIGSDDTGLVPDLNGTDNFRLTGTSEALQLIDAEPISRAEHLGVHDLVLRQANVLAAFLETA